MPRTKDFEPQEALDAAMDLLWRKGYEAVSMRELLDAMSIGRGSFYGTFGDKHALFLAALDRFREVRTSWIEEVLEESGLEAIEEVFRRSVDGLVESEVRRGCLLATSGSSSPRTTPRWLVGSTATSAARRMLSRMP